MVNFIPFDFNIINHLIDNIYNSIVLLTVCTDDIKVVNNSNFFYYFYDDCLYLIEKAFGLDKKIIDTSSFFVVLIVLFYLFINTIAKRSGELLLNFFNDNTPVPYSTMKFIQMFYFDFMVNNFIKIKGLLANDEGIEYNSVEFIYLIRNLMRKKHMIDLEVEDYLESKVLKPTYENKDGKLITKIKLEGLRHIRSNNPNNNLFCSSEAENRFEAMFNKENFGLILSTIVKGEVAYLLLVGSGSCIGTYYDNKVYTSSIKIISKTLIEKRLDLSLNDEQLVDSIALLVSLLMPNSQIEDELNKEIKAWFTNYRNELRSHYDERTVEQDISVTNPIFLAKLELVCKNLIVTLINLE